MAPPLGRINESMRALSRFLMHERKVFTTLRTAASSGKGFGAGYAMMGSKATNGLSVMRDGRCVRWLSTEFDGLDSSEKWNCRILCYL